MLAGGGRTPSGWRARRAGGAAMAAEVSGPEYRSGEHVPAGVLALVGLTGLGALMMHGWLERRFGLAEWRAMVWAGMPGALAGGLVLLGVLRSRARMDAGQRLRAAMAAEPKRRRHRRWLILMLGMLLLGQISDWPGFFASARLIAPCRGGKIQLRSPILSFESSRRSL